MRNRKESTERARQDFEQFRQDLKVYEYLDRFNLEFIPKFCAYIVLFGSINCFISHYGKRLLENSQSQKTSNGFADEEKGKRCKEFIEILDKEYGISIMILNQEIAVRCKWQSIHH